MCYFHLELMSAPARQFEKLCINTEMPTTRRQAQGLSSARAPGPEGSSTASSGDDSNDETGGPSQQSRSRTETSEAKGKQPARSEAFENSESSTDPSDLGITSRAYKTRDILSTFDEHVLPEEIQPVLFESVGTRRSPAQCLRPGNLEGTILLLAVNNHAVYKSLNKAQPAAKRAVEFFEKVMKRGGNYWTSLTITRTTASRTNFILAVNLL